MAGSFGSLHARQHPEVSGLIVVATGLGAGLIGALLLRRNGPGWRVGRLLSAAPQRSLEEARSIAASGQPAYIRLHGRIDSDEEFPGDDGKPIVFRRRRLQQGLAAPAGRPSTTSAWRCPSA